jgi:hypothetical protein
MKDAIYIACAVIGLVLTTVGVSQVQESMRRKSHPDTIPGVVEKILSTEMRQSSSYRSSESNTVPVETVAYLLFGYALQIVACAVYAESRGRSALFGLLGLLSPIGYVFLALLNPATPQGSRGWWTETSDE